MEGRRHGCPLTRASPGSTVTGIASGAGVTPPFTDGVQVCMGAKQIKKMGGVFGVKGVRNRKVSRKSSQRPLARPKGKVI